VRKESFLLPQPWLWKFTMDIGILRTQRKFENCVFFNFLFLFFLFFVSFFLFLSFFVSFFLFFVSLFLFLDPFFYFCLFFLILMTFALETVILGRAKILKSWGVKRNSQKQKLIFH
jgi:hypothetical protein